ncbi:MAG: SMC family ATPase, partial [Clostridia bacterium]|nr:SMC family ATPase [Clostridia bacterium]
REGEPCPVCGARHHPDPAGKSPEAPSEAQVERGEELARQCGERAGQLSSAAARLRGAVESRETEVARNAETLMGPHDPLMRGAVVDQATEKAQAALSDCKGRLREEDNRLHRRQSLEKAVAEQTSALRDCEEGIQKLRTRQGALAGALEQMERTAEERAEKLKYPDRQAAEERIRALGRQAGALKADREQAERAVRTGELELEKLNAAIRQREEQLKDRPTVDAEALKAERDERAAEREALSTLQREADARSAANRRALENLKDRAGELSALDRKWQWVNDLSATANGTAGPGKLMLETYVQATYFDRILRRANVHLMRMSGGKFDLVRRQESGDNRVQSGLEIDVIDHYNGSRRNVETLSGGESFIASLALALGLSEEIQMSAGGIHMDTLFVDEGFGSLDEETLRQAMQALNSLTEGDRLIGIISHVGELRREIDRQILVRKENTGGSTVTVVRG